MPTVADVLRRYGGEYLERFGAAMPAEHKKVLHAIMACRTGELGTVFYACSSCGRMHAMGRSCGNRHCPTCQQDKTRVWLEKQTARLLPCPYFLLTFTLPAELRSFVRSHQRVCYAALFEASSQAIAKLAADPKYVGAKAPGFFGVLHTWGRTLEYHPHVHYVVPGGRHQRRRRHVASFADGLLRPRQSPLDHLPRQVPRRHAEGRSFEQDRSGCVADGLGGPLASRGRRPGFAEVPGALRLSRSDQRSADHLLGRRSGDLFLSQERDDSLAEDDSSSDGIHPPLSPARIAVRLSKGAALRVSQPEFSVLDRRRAMAGRAALRQFVPASGENLSAGVRAAADPLPCMRRGRMRDRLLAASGSCVLRHQLIRCAGFLLLRLPFVQLIPRANLHPGKGRYRSAHNGPQATSNVSETSPATRFTTHPAISPLAANLHNGLPDTLRSQSDPQRALLARNQSPNKAARRQIPGFLNTGLEVRLRELQSSVG
jgi:hypothetical protein